MRIFVLAMIAMFCATGAMATTFTNGDFEDPYVAVKTVGVPTGWTSYFASGTLVYQLEPGGTQLPGSHQWCQMYNSVLNAVGGLYQTFDTVPGATYTIQGTAASVHAEDTARIGVVQGGFVSRPVNTDSAWILSCPGSVDLLWHSVVTPIVATGTSMTIFVDSTNVAATTKVSRVVKFDNIMIPEPGSIVALLSGLLGMGAVIRRRK